MTHAEKAEQRRQAAEMLRQGETTSEVAQRFERSVGWARDVCAEFHIAPLPRPRKVRKVSALSVVADLINTEDTLREIGERHGVTHQRVHQIADEAKAAGIELHPARQMYAEYYCECGNKKSPQSKTCYQCIANRRSEYVDQKRSCPECYGTFVWTARQQYNRARNTRAGRTLRRDLVFCSRTCSTTWTRRNERV